jgi:hypothetical protein
VIVPSYKNALEGLDEQIRRQIYVQHEIITAAPDFRRVVSHGESHEVSPDPDVSLEGRSTP